MTGDPFNWIGGGSVDISLPAENGILEYGNFYKWRARVIDQMNVPTEWVEFGANGDETDFAISNVSCGNNVIDPGEECDGTNLNGETCIGNGFDGGIISCTPVCKLDKSLCTDCGNGIREGAEECDGSDLGGQTCQTRGYVSGTLSCNASCSIVENCKNEICGNGIIEPSNGEQCDSENLGGLICTNFDAFIGGNLRCVNCIYNTDECTPPPVTYCGDGTIDSGEQCDDGNSNNGDGCSNICKIEDIYKIGEEKVIRYCGDGQKESGEECDDGNTNSGDGCSNICTIEKDGSYCGDGKKDAGEECDDGNSKSGDGCSNICKLEKELPRCGNGIIEPGEQCDGDNFGKLKCDDFYGFKGGKLMCNDKCIVETDKCIKDGTLTIGNLPITGTIKDVISALFAAITGVLLPIILILGFPSILFKRQKNPWGIVYDAVTVKPIAFATVRVLKSGVFFTQKVTDLEGRYGFVIGDGNYELEVNHSGYEQFKVQTEVRGNNIGINRDIALKPLIGRKFNLKSYIKQKINDAREFFPKLSIYLYVFGFIFSVLALLISPVLYNYIIICLYIIEGIVYLIWGVKRNWGRVYNSKNKMGISGAFVRLFDAKENKLIDNQITNEKGGYIFITKPGLYNILCSKQGFSFPSRVETNKLKRSFYGSLIEFELKGKRHISIDIAMDEMSSDMVNKLRLQTGSIPKFGSHFGQM